MNKKLQGLARNYATIFRDYLSKEGEAVLEQAYEVGRVAIAQGFGVLDMARIHQNALDNALQIAVGSKHNERVLKAAETLLLESLSPFEATHRGFRETNIKLQERNQELEGEIRGRKRVEGALRRSEKHYHKLFHEAKLMQENLRNLSNKILRTQEEERKCISRELHDEVGQSLTAISVMIATLRDYGTGGSNNHAQKIVATQTLLQETMETVHRFARDLRPSMLDELGLLPALRSCLKGFASRTGLRVCFRGNSIVEKLGDDQKTVIFRIAQECLTNVSKHARASQVAVTIRKIKDGICMEVSDNGKSFHPDQINNAKSQGRLGLLGMQERVRLVNGHCSIKPQPGKGTTVRVTIPFKAAAPASALNGYLPEPRKSGLCLTKQILIPTERNPKSIYGEDQSFTGR
jgi:signal transduction histidine kinase